MSDFRFTVDRAAPLPFRVLLKIALLAGGVVIVPLYSFLAWAEMGYPGRREVRDLGLVVLLGLGGWLLYRILRQRDPGNGNSGHGPAGPMVREPRPPNGRPPALSATARPEQEN